MALADRPPAGEEHVGSGSVADDAVSALGPGTALDAASRAEFEPRFGRDFGAVRVHTGPRADALAAPISARAFTLGHDIVVSSDQPGPGSSAGRRLLAHELTHVVQQGGAGRLAGRSGAEATPGPVGAVSEIDARRVRRAVSTWKPAVRADETAANFDAATTEVPITGGAAGFDRFSVYLPSGVQPDTPNKVQVFFAANAVAGGLANDVMIHGLRAAAEASKWILIGVPGFDNPPSPGYQTISTAQIKACLAAAGRANTDIAALRLTAHSRGHRGLEKTLMGSLVDTSLIDRVTILDAFYQDTKKAISGAGIDKAKVVQYDLVDALGTQPGERSRIAGDKRLLFNANPPACPHSLSHYLAAIGYVRLLTDMRTTTPEVAALLATLPKVSAGLASVTLPPRGSFMTFGSGGLGTDLTTWVIANHAALDAILAVDDDLDKGGLLAFINRARFGGTRTLLGFGPMSRDIAAHHFFVAEIAHELFE
jgi:hypothetical protein